MARKELHTSDIKIEQRPAVDLDTMDVANRSGDIIKADRLPDKEYMEELAFMDEPVTIRIEPSSEKNAALHHPIWNNGRGAEIWNGKRWVEVTYLPVGEVLTVKRKYVETLLRAKTDTIQTEVKDMEGGDKHNTYRKFTSALASFSILKDENPRSLDWVEAVRSTNF